MSAIDPAIVGALTIPAAAKLKQGDLIRVLGPGSWELVEPDPRCPECAAHLAAQRPTPAPTEES